MDAHELPSSALSGAFSALLLIGSWLWWLLRPNRKTLREKENHRKLLFQNYCAAVHVFREQPTFVAGNGAGRSVEISAVVTETLSLLKRLIGTRKGLKRKEVSRQLSYNKELRSYFADASNLQVDFDARFTPRIGWHDLLKMRKDEFFLELQSNSPS